MQLATTKFTKNDLAKYPFLKAAKRYMKIPDLKIEDLTSPDLEEIVKRAEERVEEAILYVRVSRKLKREDIEISSYPVAILLATATGSTFIKKRYALAEAKQAYEDLKDEPKAMEKILGFAQNFGWKLTLNNDAEIPYEFTIHFTDYLRNTTHLREKKWKLVNRLLSKGNVYLTRNEAARLLSEEVRKHIEKRLEVKELPKLPQKIMETAEKIKKLSVEKIGKTEMEGFPKTIVQTAFPPCIQALYQAFSSGRHLSHVGRFALTSFLINIGMPPEKVIELFKNFSDYNERMTQYQVEHIAGERGSRTRYIPPKCDTLQTHGVCTSPDELCKILHHPLAYYRRKVKTAKIDFQN
ncbi:MAG: DNA primase large subunit PriL [Candidatus Bathyarchaeota archaeon]|nr:DNA primase large subunit PriL [Candidatus Bathyarchaeota archaeon]